MFYGWDTDVVMLQSIECVRIRGDDPFGSRTCNCRAILIAEGTEEEFFSKTPYLVSAVFFGRTKDREIIPKGAQDSRSRPANRLNPIVV